MRACDGNHFCHTATTAATIFDPLAKKLLFLALNCAITVSPFDYCVRVSEPNLEMGLSTAEEDSLAKSPNKINVHPYAEPSGPNFTSRKQSTASPEDVSAMVFAARDETNSAHTTELNLVKNLHLQIIHLSAINSVSNTMITTLDIHGPQ
jgi:hypothetical protein